MVQQHLSTAGAWKTSGSTSSNYWLELRRPPGRTSSGWRTITLCADGKRLFCYPRRRAGCLEPQGSSAGRWQPIICAPELVLDAPGKWRSASAGRTASSITSDQGKPALSSTDRRNSSGCADFISSSKASAGCSPSQRLARDDHSAFAATAAKRVDAVHAPGPWPLRKVLAQ